MLQNRIIYFLKNLDWGIIGSSFFLTSLGLLSIYSSSQENFLNFYKQLVFFLLGIIFLFLFAKFDYRLFRTNSFFVLFLYFLGLVLLSGLFIFGKEIRGTRAWYHLGIISLSPTELVKIILVIVLAKFFSLRHKELYKIRHIILSGIYVFIPAILVYKQPDLGSVLILIALWIGMLFVSGIKMRHFLILVLVGIILLVFAWNNLLKDYQKERIISLLKPDYKPLEIGWNQRQAKIAIGNGGLFGQGFKKGTQTQYGFLPEPQTDFIFSAIAEEFGFFAIFLLLVAYFYLIWRIIKISFLAQDNFARLFCSGIAILLISQFFVNVGTNLGFLPVIGLPLYFVSYGGSSLLFMYIALGIVENIFITSKRTPKRETI